MPCKGTEAGEARVVPIILRSCDWLNSPLQKLKALPKDGKPVEKWRRRDDAYLSIAEGVREIVKEFNSAKQTPVTVVKNKPAAAVKDSDDKVTLAASLSIGGELTMLQKLGCPYLSLRLVCKSERPAKIGRVELRLRGSQYIPHFQAAFGRDFGYTPVPGSPNEDSFAIHFRAETPANLGNGFRIERDEACLFYLAGLAFPMHIYTNGAAADVSIAITFLDGHTETIVHGEAVQRQIGGLLEMCMAKPYVLNDATKTGMSLHVSSMTPPDVSAVGAISQKPVEFGQTGLDVFGDFPEITAIGQAALQEHCDEWLKSSIARQCHVKTVTIGRTSRRLIIADVGLEAPPDVQPGEIMHFPLDYLLSFLIDRIVPGEQRNRLKAIMAKKRFNAGPGAYQQFKIAPKKRLGVKCKNPACRLTLITQVMGYRGQPFMAEIEPVTCPRCGVRSSYEAKDFFVIPDHVAQRFSTATGPAAMSDQSGG